MGREQRTQRPNDRVWDGERLLYLGPWIIAHDRCFIENETRFLNCLSQTPNQIVQFQSAALAAGIGETAAQFAISMRDESGPIGDTWTSLDP